VSAPIVFATCLWPQRNESWGGGGRTPRRAAPFSHPFTKRNLTNVYATFTGPKHLPDLRGVTSFDCVSLRLRDDSLVQLGNMLWLRYHDLTNQVNEFEQL